ncbi:hypothetical protein C2845_PM03G29060 [Panicum miliaceum]|uniref:Uncharacterized protein n=1 Tax=Panicum miliaceum TaxID=4540 RepID=A0A3L6TB37_PANMI|nr:hypothetical protein C2845_PM03G29060 [Panicum miliaceum]
MGAGWRSVNAGDAARVTRAPLQDRSRPISWADALTALQGTMSRRSAGILPAASNAARRATKPGFASAGVPSAAARAGSPPGSGRSLVAPAEMAATTALLRLLMAAPQGRMTPDLCAPSLPGVRRRSRRSVLPRHVAAPMAARGLNRPPPHHRDRGPLGTHLAVHVRRSASCNDPWRLTLLRPGSRLVLWSLWWAAWARLFLPFSSAADADRVLHAHYPDEAPFQLIWKRWRRQSTASLASFRFRVLIEFTGIPAHARNLGTARTVLDTSCSDLVEAPPELTDDHRKKFFICAWCFHPDLVPQQKLVFIPEPPEPYDESGLFLRPHEIIHSKHDGLWYNVKIRIVEVQDWNLPSGSSDDGTPPVNFDSEENEYPGFDQHCRSKPWPKKTHFDGDGAGPSHGPSLGPGWGAPFASCSAEPRPLKLPLRFGRLKLGVQPLKNSQSEAPQSVATVARVSPVELEVDPGQLRAPSVPLVCAGSDPMVADGLLRPKACTRPC